MKKLALFPLVLVCVLVSCKKSNSGSSGYHVNATIGGKSKAFNLAEPIGLIEKSGQIITSLVITAGLDTTTHEAIQIQLSSFTDKGIVPGTYIDTAGNCDNQVIYDADKDNSYYAGTQVAGWAASANITLKNHLKIVITSIDDKTAKGTFSGDMFLNGTPGPAPLTVTSGDFYVNVE